MRDLRNKKKPASKSRNREIAKSRNFLEGLVVADFTRILAGPLCTMLLGDLGARVIKVEEPGRGDETRRWGPPFVGGESAYFLSVNRNKESIAVDLKSSSGREIAKRLIARSDVVIENFRDEQRRQFGFTPAAIRKLNPRAVFCSITGFDRDSEQATEPGYDLLAQASAGLMWITGPADGSPSKTGVAIADVLTGHYAFGAILAALYARQKSGKGSAVEVSIFGATAASLVNVAQNVLVTGNEAKRYGNEHPSIVPYQAFQGADRMFVVAAASDRHFELLCREVIGRPELAIDERYRTNASRVQNRERLTSMLAAVFKAQPASSWVDACRLVGIPAAVVAGVRDIFRDHPELISTIDHPVVGELPQVRNPVRVDSRSLKIGKAPPLLNADAGSILKSLGFSKREIEKLRS